MDFLKKLLVPVIIFVVAGIVTYFVFDGLGEAGQRVLFYPLVAELGVVLYFWQYQLTKSKRSGIFYIYLSLIMIFAFVFTLIVSFLYANGSMAWNSFLLLFWIVIGISLVVAGLLKFIYAGLNDSISNQERGEHGLAKMKQVAKETMFVLEQYRKDASEPIKILKEVEEALEYSDPVSHKNVYSIERQIMSGLKTALRHAKNKHFGKIKAVMKDSNGVLFLIDKRNTVLRDSK
jgi:hypothetical protein